ncbi:hypothetical protein BAXH7_02712 [Bacillus amyloliquefaciens XH7]|nr:hypothetical protein LL3_02788 [Bacillus amyloliquefaciens LL3]AEK89838.1 hypothetical protein BAXH7_02712 [Bacillus amyloliquefaciens XH7]QBG57098.1 hypothetical protein D2M30_2770 [Bacillus amyloliquefaciens]
MCHSKQGVVKRLRHGSTADIIRSYALFEWERLKKGGRYEY